MGEARIDYGDREVCGGVWGGGGVEEMGEALIDYGDRECAEVSGCVDAARGEAYFDPAVRRASGRFRLGAANARCGLVDQDCARAQGCARPHARPGEAGPGGRATSTPLFRRALSSAWGPVVGHGRCHRRGSSTTWLAQRAWRGGQVWRVFLQGQLCRRER